MKFWLCLGNKGDSQNKSPNGVVVGGGGGLAAGKFVPSLSVLCLSRDQVDSSGSCESLPSPDELTVKWCKSDQSFGETDQQDEDEQGESSTRMTSMIDRPGER